jgi:hypothetical protein
MFNLFKPPVCSHGEPLPNKFKWTISPHLPSGGKDGQDKTYCKTHFILEISRILNAWNYPFILCEPLDSKAPNHVVPLSQSYYIIPQDMHHYNFPAEDAKAVEELLKRTTSELPVIWLPKEAVGEVFYPPLIKNAQLFSIVSKEEALSKFAHALNNYDSLEKGEYQINLPYSGPGIIIYQPEL